ncbi:MAG: Putative inner membrane protein, partial [uncultured Ramlibacter sp.]
EPTTRHRCAARPGFRPGHPLPRGDVLRARVGVAPQEPGCGRVAAGPHAGAQPLANGPGVPGIGTGAQPAVAGRLATATAGPAQRAIAAAAGLRNGGRGAVPALRRNGRQRRDRAGFRRLSAPVFHGWAMARHRVPRRERRRDLEPPLVPALPLALHHRLRAGGSAAAVGCRPAPARRIPAAARLATAGTAGPAADAVFRRAVAALPAVARPDRRRLAARRLLHAVPVRLVDRAGRRLVGRAEAPAPSSAGSCAGLAGAVLPGAM